MMGILIMKKMFFRLFIHKSDDKVFGKQITGRIFLLRLQFSLENPIKEAYIICLIGKGAD